MTYESNIKYFSQSELWDKPPVDEQNKVVDDLIAMIPQDTQTILDAGCGNGILINRLNKKWLAFGCDISEVALRKVRGKKTLADIAALPYPDNAFDLVISSDVIEHITDEYYAKVLSELSRVAKRYLLIAVPYEELLEEAGVVCPKCLVSYHAHLHQRAYSTKKMTELFGESFGVKQVKLSGERWLFYDEKLVKLKKELTQTDYSFESACCPNCDTRRGQVIFPSSSREMARRFDALQAMLSLNHISPLPNKSEILVLYEFGQKSHKIDIKLNQSSKPKDLADINFSLLTPCQDIPNYPDKVICTKDGDSYLILAIPCLPKSLKIKTGRYQSIEIYDSVKQCYLNCEYLAEDTLTIPQVPNDAKGSLLRVSGYTNDLILIPIYGHKRSKEEIFSICFSDQDQLQQLRKLLLELDKASKTIRAFERKQAKLTKQMVTVQKTNPKQKKDFATEQAHLQAANQKLVDLAEELEQKRSKLDNQVLTLQEVNDQQARNFAKQCEHMQQDNQKLATLVEELEQKRTKLDAQVLILQEINAQQAEHFANKYNLLKNINDKLVASTKTLQLKNQFSQINSILQEANQGLIELLTKLQIE